MLVFGFTGILSLYGLSCGNSEGQTKEIEWEQIKGKKKMNAIKDLRIDDVISYLEGDEEDEVYSMKAESFTSSGVMTPQKVTSCLKDKKRQ